MLSLFDFYDLKALLIRVECMRFFRTDTSQDTFR
jgi:hypothetical protein